MGLEQHEDEQMTDLSFSGELSLVTGWVVTEGNRTYSAQLSVQSVLLSSADLFLSSRPGL